jgi:nicotinamide-nucleotide amidase
VLTNLLSLEKLARRSRELDSFNRDCIMKSFNYDQLSFIGKQLINKHQTIAVAESVSAGLLQFSIGSIMDAAKFFHGGITVYNVAQKFKHLNVEPIHALEVDAVSQQVANQMALHVQSLFTSHWGVGITGYASPVTESGNSLFAYYAIAFNNKMVDAGKLIGEGDKPDDVQFYYVQEIISALHYCLIS